MLAKFSGLNPKGPYQSFEREKETLMCFVHLLRKASLRKQPFLLAFRRQLSLRSMAALVAEVIKTGEGRAGYRQRRRARRNGCFRRLRKVGV